MQKKEAVKRALRRWRKGDEQGTKYRKERKEYRSCERKRKEKNERWEKEVEEIRSEEMV